MKKILLMVITVALSVSMFGGSFHTMLMLDRPLEGSPASMAMGGLSILPPEGAGNTPFAPASIAPEEGIFAHVGGNIIQQVERREIPLFDSFGSTIAYTAYSNNKSTLGRASVFAGYRLGGEYSPAISVGYAPFYDANYEYEEQVRNESDVITGTNHIKSEGLIAGPAVSANIRISRWGMVGAGVHILSGTIDYERSAMDTRLVQNYENLLLRDSLSTEYSATAINISAVATPIEHLEIGLKYRPQVKAEDVAPLNSVIPSTFGFGLCWKPTGYVMSRLVFEAENTAWSELGEEDANFEQLEDAWAFRFGVEHLLPSGTMFRAGAYHHLIPLNEEIVTTGFTAGSQIRIWHATIDIAGGYEMRNYYYHSLFPTGDAPEEGESETLEHVKDSRLFGSVGVNVNF